MAQLLDEIQWGEPFLLPVADPAWEAEIKHRGGQVSEVDRRIPPNAWVREAGLGLLTYRPSELPQRLFNIGSPGYGAGEFLPVLLWRQPGLHENPGLFGVFHQSPRA